LRSAANRWGPRCDPEIMWLFAGSRPTTMDASRVRGTPVRVEAKQHERAHEETGEALPERVRALRAGMSEFVAAALEATRRSRAGSGT
jgi:hypothetical protein